jgi:hypothetical protein
MEHLPNDKVKDHSMEHLPNDKVKDHSREHLPNDKVKNGLCYDLYSFQFVLAMVNVPWYDL